MQWAPRERVLLVQKASSQNGNYLVWVLLIWVTGVQMSHEIQGPTYSPSQVVNQRSGKSSLSKTGLPGRPIPKGQCQSLPEMGENWRLEEGLSELGWPLGARAVLCTWHSLGPPGTQWPHFSKTILLVPPRVRAHRTMRSRLRNASSIIYKNERRG